MNTVASSSSPRRRHVVTSSGSESASSSRSVAAICGSGSGKKRRIRCSSSPAPASNARNGSVETAAAHIVCSSRGGPGSTTTIGDAPRMNPGAVPAGSSTAAPAGTCACLRAPARIAASSPPTRARRRVTIPQIRSSSAGSSSIVNAHPRRDDVGGQIVRGRPQAARRDDQVDVPEEVQRRDQIRRPVADHDRMPQLDAVRPQLLRQPRPVGIGDQAAQHLGAGDDDPRAHAHVAQSPTRTRSLSRFGALPGRNS